MKKYTASKLMDGGKNINKKNPTIQNTVRKERKNTQTKQIRRI